MHYSAVQGEGHNRPVSLNCQAQADKRCRSYSVRGLHRAGRRDAPRRTAPLSGGAMGPWATVHGQRAQTGPQGGPKNTGVGSATERRRRQWKRRRGCAYTWCVGVGVGVTWRVGVWVSRSQSHDFVALTKMRDPLGFPHSAHRAQCAPRI